MRYIVFYYDIFGQKAYDEVVASSAKEAIDMVQE